TFRGVPLVYSHEAELLGTLGALGPLREFFRACDAVVVVNGDSLCRWPVGRLLARHRRRGAAATLLFAGRAEPLRYGGGVAVGPRGRVVAFAPGDTAAEAERKIRRRVFAGAHVLSPELLERVPDGPGDFVSDLYRPLLAEGAELAAVVTGRPWFDLGTPRRYRDAATEGGITPRWLRRLRRTWVAAGTRTGRRVRLRRSVVEEGGELGSRVRLRRTLLLPGVRVGAGSRLEGCIVGPGATLPAGSRITRRLVCRRTAGGAVPPGSSVVGELIYTPLDPPPRGAASGAPGPAEGATQAERRRAPAGTPAGVDGSAGPAASRGSEPAGGTPPSGGRAGS
ncbi:MAG: sugar phosphate nucleotidyltransferase, partial [Thermoanaerobaculia bacterium]